MKSISHKVIDRPYKNVSSSESIAVSKVNNPVKVIDGKIVEVDKITRQPIK